MTTESAATPGQRVLTRVPSGPAGWWHQYVCPVHGTELVGPAPDGRSPESHLCSQGCRVQGAEYDGAWRVLQHQECARALRGSAHRYVREGHEPSRAEAVTLLEEYADLYASAQSRGWSDEAQPWMLRGKLFHQALTEAIWGTVVADAVAALAVGDRRVGGPGQDLTVAVPLLTGLLATMTEARSALVDERGELRNNYTAWLNCAGATAERALAALGRPAPEDTWLAGPSGLYSFLGAAVGDDGWEWEGATYYHVFVLRACLIAVGGLSPAELPPDFVARIEGMLRVLVDLSTEDGLVPVLHDGPYRRRPALQELLETCVLGRQLVDVPGLDSIELGTRRSLSPEDTLVEDRLGDWFAGGGLAASSGSLGPRRSTRWSSVGYLVLRSPSRRWHAVVDAGPHGGSHGHRDKLALYLYAARGAWQPAPGVPPYGSRLRAGHYATTAAHPTFRVDGRDQAECAGEVLDWSIAPHETSATVAVDGAFPGVRARRHLVMTEGYLLDALHVTSERPAHLSVGLRPARPLDFTLVGDTGHSRWLADGAGADERLRGLHRSTPAGSFEVVPGRGPSDQPSPPLGVVDWGTDASAAWFVSLYQVEGSAPAPLGTLDLLAEEHGLTVTLTGASGSVRHRFESGPAPSTTDSAHPFPERTS